MAADLYATLNNFYRRHLHFQRRPLYITGESYGEILPCTSPVNQLQLHAFKLASADTCECCTHTCSLPSLLQTWLHQQHSRKHQPSPHPARWPAVLHAAGKYLPSLGHYIIQADAMAHGEVDKLHKTRSLPEDVEEPLFTLGGMAIGNGFTGQQGWLSACV